MLELLRTALRPTLSLPEQPEHERAAAVAAIFRKRAQVTEVLLIERAEREGDPWSGHMALPGGRRAPTDTALRDTAIRETMEEIGLDLRVAGELIGMLPAEDATGRGSPQPLSILPFAFELLGEQELRLNHEVKEVIWTPVEPLLRGERRTSVKIKHAGQDWELPGWQVEGRVVWGLTYRMLTTLFLRLPSQ